MYFLFIMQTWNMMNTVNVITNFMIMIYVEHIVVYILFHFLELKKNWQLTFGYCYLLSPILASS